MAVPQISVTTFVASPKALLLAACRTPSPSTMPVEVKVLLPERIRRPWPSLKSLPLSESAEPTFNVSAAVSTRMSASAEAPVPRSSVPPLIVATPPPILFRPAATSSCGLTPT